MFLTSKNVKQIKRPIKPIIVKVSITGMRILKNDKIPLIWSSIIHTMLDTTVINIKITGKKTKNGSTIFLST